jgi:thiamine kinase-like enzyme
MLQGSDFAETVLAAAPEFVSSVREAIEKQLAERPGTRGAASGAQVDAVTKRLVGQALAARAFGASTVGSPTPFSAGHTAEVVGSVRVSLDYVVKVDGNPKVVREARLLQRISTDVELPELLRHAFPAIYAVADSPPLYGYLMEHLDGYEPLHETLQTNPTAAGRVLNSLWDNLLLPAYERTVTARRPDVIGDYIGRVQERFAHSADIPEPHRPLRIEAAPNSAIDISTGWGQLLERAAARVAELAPPFGTFVHGDPNPENILWRETDPLEIRLIDPKDWWIGDPLFDIAKIGHYLRVTAPVEQYHHPAEHHDSGAATIVCYDTAPLDVHQSLEKTLLAAYEQSATDPVGNLSDPSWEERYDFAVASNLLGIVAPRAEKGRTENDQVQRNLAWIAFGEGMRRLVKRLP